MSTHPHANNWNLPANEARSKLVVYNSLTRRKDPLIPCEGNRIRWYNCGPTVYDASHIGHARNYVTFDCVRRILEDYFAYDVTLVMNITDIDDKIIIRARQAHLYENFCANRQQRNDNLDSELWSYLEKFCQSKLKVNSLDDFIPPSDVSEASAKIRLFHSMASKAGIKLDDKSASVQSILEAFRDVLLPLLDGPIDDNSIFRKLAAHWETDFMDDMRALNVRRPTLLTRVSEYVPQVIACIERIISNGFAYVAEGSVYFSVEDFTRAGHTYGKLSPWSVSDHTPTANDPQPDFLQQNASFQEPGENMQLSQEEREKRKKQADEEGEGSLGIELQGKRGKKDFALWKASKAGEPWWPSPWGNGRPGWHIECSAMAAAVIPGTIDIHSGGIDLIFPHHENEIAQADAYYAQNCCAPESQDSKNFLQKSASPSAADAIHNFHGEKLVKNQNDYVNGQWANYFLHAGHVHIEGLKMSKSLKNFVSIKEALSQSSARELRLLFLQHTWSAPMTYSEGGLRKARALDTQIANFYASINALTREKLGEAEPCNFGDLERGLMDAVEETGTRIRAALCDSFETPLVLLAIQELIGKFNSYIAQVKNANAHVLRAVLKCVDRIVSLLGLEYGKVVSETDSEYKRLMDVLEAVSSFRDRVRSTLLASDLPAAADGPFDQTSSLDLQVGMFSGQESSPANDKLVKKAILELSDKLRDTLLDCGVSIEDRGTGQKSLIKLLSPEQVARVRLEQMEAAACLAEKNIQRIERLRLEASRKAERLERASRPPQTILEGYSAYGPDGMPTHGNQGEPLSKGAIKKLAKLYAEQCDLHERYKAGTL